MNDVTALLCWCCKHWGQPVDMPPELERWWQAHQEADRVREQERELAESLRRQADEREFERLKAKLGR